MTSPVPNATTPPTARVAEGHNVTDSDVKWLRSEAVDIRQYGIQQKYRTLLQGEDRTLHEQHVRHQFETADRYERIAAALTELDATRRERAEWEQIARTNFADFQAANDAIATLTRARDEAQAAVVGAQRERDEARQVAEGQRTGMTDVDDSERILRSVVDHAYEYGYHEHGYDIVAGYRDAIVASLGSTAPTPAQVERAARDDERADYERTHTTDAQFLETLAEDGSVFTTQASARLVRIARELAELRSAHAGRREG